MGMEPAASKSSNMTSPKTKVNIQELLHVNHIMKKESTPIDGLGDTAGSAGKGTTNSSNTNNMNIKANTNSSTGGTMTDIKRIHVETKTFGQSVPVLSKAVPPKIDFEWPFPNFRHAHKLWKVKSAATIFLVGMCGKAVMNWMNSTKICNEKRLLEAIFRRPDGTPLITYCNHESCCDDPMLLSLFFKPRHFLNADKMRWSLAAHDICFTKDWHGKGFSLGKCVPIVRGLGVQQRAVDFVIDRLNHSGDWLHIFPEGKINMERNEIQRLKWGVGRIISECRTKPIVIPFWHTGMADILPNYAPYYPRLGKSVVVNVGKPLDIDDLLSSSEHLSCVQRRKVITDFLQDELVKLREETLKITNDLVKSNK